MYTSLKHKYTRVTLNYRWQPVSKKKVGSDGASSSKGNGTNNNARGSTVEHAAQDPVHLTKSDVQNANKFIHDDLSDIVTRNPFGALSDEVTNSVMGPEVGVSQKEQSDHVMEIDSDQEVDETIECGKPNTPIIEKIDKLEKLIMDGTATLVDDNGKPVPVVEGIKKGNPFSKVGNVVVTDSDDEVFEPDDSMRHYGSSSGGLNELEDYFSDDYAAQVLDLPEQLEEFTKMFDFKVQGKSRK